MNGRVPRLARLIGRLRRQSPPPFPQRRCTWVEYPRGSGHEVCLVHENEVRLAPRVAA